MISDIHSDSAHRRQREAIGLPVDPPTPPIVHENCSPTERRRRELAELPSSTSVNVGRLTEQQRRGRALSGITESLGTMAVRGNSVLTASPDRAPESESYSFGGAARGVTGAARDSFDQSRSPHPLPDPVAARADLVRVWLKTLDSLVAMDRPAFASVLRGVQADVEQLLYFFVNHFASNGEDDIAVAETLRQCLNMLGDALEAANQMAPGEVAKLARLLRDAISLITAGKDEQGPQLPGEATQQQGQMLTEQAQIFVMESSPSQDSALMKVRATLIKGDQVNRNHRLYKSEYLRREAAALQEKLRKGETLFAQADHPADGVPRIHDTAAMWTAIRYDEGAKEIVGEASILNTTAGKDLAELIRSGAAVGVSCRGFGTTTSRGDISEVNSDWSLHSADFVIGPSFDTFATRLN